MKKLSAILLIFALCLVPMAGMEAAGEVMLSVGSAEVAPNGTATVTVTVTGNPGVAYLSLRIDCDPSVEVLKAENGTLYSYFTYGKQVILAESDNKTACGTLFTFTVKAPQKTGAYKLSVAVVECSNIEEQDVPAKITSGLLTVECSHGDTVSTAAKAPTCKEAGFTAGVYCNLCKTYISGHTELPKTETHTWNSGVETKSPTCISTGMKTFTCTVCNITKTESVPANGHQAVKDAAVAPTATKSGLTEGSHCSVCSQVLIPQQVIPPTGGDMAGDINSDGKVTVADLIRLSQHQAGWEVEAGCLDVNGDGKENVSDLIRLAQYLAGWNVEIFA